MLTPVNPVGSKVYVISRCSLNCGNNAIGQKQDAMWCLYNVFTNGFFKTLIFHPHCTGRASSAWRLSLFLHSLFIIMPVTTGIFGFIEQSNMPNCLIHF